MEDLTDPTLPIQDLHANVESPSIAGGYTFSLFGQTAQVTAALPYAWAQLTGTVGGNAQSTNRSGLSDMRLRFSVLLLGAPASSPGELAKDGSLTSTRTSGFLQKMTHSTLVIQFAPGVLWALFSHISVTIYRPECGLLST